MATEPFQVIVKPRSSRNEVVEKDGKLIVYTTELPIKGQANKKVIKLLAEHFKVSKSCIRIIRGHTKKQKFIKVEC